jgi:hypothetical protein
MYRSLWVPSGRAEPFFPLCPRRSSWIRCPRDGAGLPPARVAAHAPSDIIRTRSPRCASFWRAYCCDNCLTALFAGCLQTERRRRNQFHQCRFAAGSVARCAMRPRVTRLGRVSPQRGNASHLLFPAPSAGHYCYFLQTDNRKHGDCLISGPTHGDKAAAVGHHRLPPPVVCGRPPSEGVHKSPSRLALRHAVE